MSDSSITNLPFTKTTAVAADLFVLDDSENSQETTNITFANLVASIGAEMQTPWTQDIDADGFDLTDLSNIEFRTTTGAPGTGVQAIFADAGGINVNLPSGDTLDIIINGFTQYSFKNTEADFEGQDLALNGGEVHFDSSTIISQPTSTADMQFDLVSGGSYDYFINDILEYTFTETELSLEGNNITLGSGGAYQFDSSTTRIVESSPHMEFIIDRPREVHTVYRR